MIPPIPQPAADARAALKKLFYQSARLDRRMIARPPIAPAQAVPNAIPANTIEGTNFRNRFAIPECMAIFIG